MRYQAAAYHTSTDDVVAELGHWETRQAAVMICEQHALQTLAFEELWPTCWEARATVYWYRIQATPN